jgi:predicted ATPase
MARYQALIADGTLTPDPAQARVAAQLDALGQALNGYRPVAARQNWAARLGLPAHHQRRPLGCISMAPLDAANRA